MIEVEVLVTVRGTESRDERSERDERGENRRSRVGDGRESERERRGPKVQVDSPRNLGDESDTKYMRDADRRVESE